MQKYENILLDFTVYRFQRLRKFHKFFDLPGGLLGVANKVVSFVMVTAIGAPRGTIMPSALGLVPFVGLATIAAFADESLRATAITAIVAYGAVILSFLGGIQWGLAVHHGAVNGPNPCLLWIGVAPSLAGWLALMQPWPTVGVALLAVSFVVVLLIDVWLTRRGRAPVWYPRLRIPLTTAVVTCLGVAGLAAGL